MRELRRDWVHVQPRAAERRVLARAGRAGGLAPGRGAANQKLIDYDCSANWGNWVAAAGMTGGRVNRFNIAKQTKDYDPDGEYVKAWIPELRDVPGKFCADPRQMPSDVARDAKCVSGSITPPPPPFKLPPNEFGGGGGRGGGKQQRRQGGGAGETGATGATDAGTSRDAPRRVATSAAGERRGGRKDTESAFFFGAANHSFRARFGRASGGPRGTAIARARAERYTLVSSKVFQRARRLRLEMRLSASFRDFVKVSHWKHKQRVDIYVLR